MSKSPLFSTYRQGENRVTSSMLAVFERIDLSLLETLLGAASGEASLQMVTFTNQPSGQGHSVPDGCISARFAYWFEVKTTRNAVRAGQLVEHLHSLEKGAANERLFVVTPDPAEPAAVNEMADPRVVWFSFAALYDAIDAQLRDVTGNVSEQARFLLRELQALLAEDGLLDADDVVVVAARSAYPEFLKHAAYICQPNRSFREGLTHMGFYADGRIQPHVARILHREDNVVFTAEEARRRVDGNAQDQRIGRLIDALLTDSPREPGEHFQVFLLTAHDEEGTEILTAPIINDTRAASGRTWAWTMGQRYVSLHKLTAGATVTSQLG